MVYVWLGGEAEHLQVLSSEGSAVVQLLWVLAIRLAVPSSDVWLVSVQPSQAAAAGFETSGKGEIPYIYNIYRIPPSPVPSEKKLDTTMDMKKGLFCMPNVIFLSRIGTPIDRPPKSAHNFF